MFTTTLREPIELKQRQLVDIEDHPLASNRYFGVALDTDEALRFVKQDLRVFGDKDGPYLVVVLSADQLRPPIDDNLVDVVIRPMVWKYGQLSGVKSWLETITYL